MKKSAVLIFAYLSAFASMVIPGAGCSDGGNDTYDYGASSDSDSDTDSDTDTDSDADGDVNGASGELTVDVTTSTTGGTFSPRHILAIWIENSSGDFIHTLMAYTRNTSYRHYLSHWDSATSDADARYDMTDAISGATRQSFGEMSATWDGTSYSDGLVADGKYQVCMELTDKDATGNYSCFEFTKGSDAETVTPDDKPSFSDITITWTPQ